MKRLNKNKELGLEREAGVDSCCGSPEVNWRGVTGQTGITLFSFPECMFWTHAKRQNTHYAANRRIEPSPLTKRLSPLCLSICVYKAMCVLLFVGLCTDGSVYLSFCRPPLVWQPVCLWASVHLAPRGPLAVPFAPSGRPLCCLPRCPPPPPPWCTWTLERLLWSKGFLINLRYLTHLDQRPNTG